ncbi:MAG TPA: glycogen/starch/alpha-glucan phosphorylase [Candidatus Sulfomarinibacteraceae bacterium]|nr:glycogen/starch/alpha-glucan phosphorylase [Candidatus Sulfomarinibacteraceae bacterium]
MFPAVHLKNPTAEEFRDRFLHYLRYACGLELRHARAADHLAALELAVRETLIDREILTRRTYDQVQPKTVHYLSLEYLTGRLLHNNLIATELLDVAREAMQLLGLNVDTIMEEEPDPGLGNGGLGRLAACFLDSLATLDYPAYGYGLRYDYGMFKQTFENGWQVEQADTWLQRGFRWEVRRDDLRVPVRFGGRIDWAETPTGGHKPVWADWRTAYGVPYDVLVAGFRTNTVSILRLWDAQAASEFDFSIFSQGNYVKAVAGRERVEAINRVLYPADDVEAGRRLRLAQEYFMVACSVRDVVNRFRRRHAEVWELFPDKVAFQLNDTHPALTVAELMRFFIDEAGLPWASAWELTRSTCHYTNHTLLPEALETWPVPLLEELIPRHVQIIYEINRRFVEQVRADGLDDPATLRRLSIIQEDGEKRFRMANLAIVGSNRVNGVAKLHTELLKTRVVRDFAELWPERFLAVTNGVTPRRWLRSCNPRLAAAVTGRIGGGWAKDLDRLGELAAFADDPDFQDEFLEIKRANKSDLAVEVERLCGVRLDLDSLFDVQIKRLHEYKRQLLNVMHIIHLYLRLKADPALKMAPRSFIFGAKAPPSYRMAKLIIRLVNGVAETVNADPVVAGRLRVAFLPDYRVSLAERIIPAADLSEQISTAGMEASGTGNMKLALNGALTIGTLDGANIEIRDAVGDDHIFIFGLTAQEVEARLTTGAHQPWALYRADPELAAVVDTIERGDFAGADRDVVRAVWSSLMEHGDRYMLLADFRSYLEAQERAELHYRDRRAWARSAILNLAAMGYFSSDRALLEYAEKIWNLEAVAVRTPEGS